MTTENDEQLRRWLLHELPETKAAALEERLFEDDALAAALRDAENDLLDDYARDRLAATQRRAVERHLLRTPQDRARLAFAHALAGVSRSPPQLADIAARPAVLEVTARSRRRRRFVWAGALAAGLVAIAVLTVADFAPRRLIEPTPQRADGAAFPTIALLAGVQRGAGVHAIAIPHSAANLRLQLEVEQPQIATRHALSISDGPHTLFAQRDLELRHAGRYAYVEAIVPAAVFGSGTRQITLIAQDETAPASVWTVQARAE